jgi:hypothetical protein
MSKKPRPLDRQSVFFRGKRLNQLDREEIEDAFLWVANRLFCHEEREDYRLSDLFMDCEKIQDLKQKNLKLQNDADNMANKIRQIHNLTMRPLYD